MRNLKAVIIKTIILSFFVLCLLTCLVSAQENNEMQLYNRNEKVQLSKALIHKIDDYYISVDDLSKINIQYKFEEDDEGFNFSLFSQNVFGTEHTLLIDARADELYKWDDTTGDFVSIPFYWFSNSMISKESSVNPVNIGDFQSVVIEEGVYYISLKAISIAISHEYSVSDNIIKLWITDSSHHVVSGEISLPDGEIATENEINVNVLLLNADADLTENYSFKQVCISKGENKTSYFIETDISDYYNWLMFEFDGNYKTINELKNVEYGSKLNIMTSYTEKLSLDIDVSMPSGIVAEDDVYANIIFDQCAVYKSDEPIIHKGERTGVVTLDIDKDFVGKVAFSKISGDSRLFDYGYYGYGDLKLLSDNAKIASANDSKISATLMQCYQISGQVIPVDINSGYKVRIFGVTDSQEKIYLSKDAGENFNFSIKIPTLIPKYTLSVAYKPGVYCGYISDGVSNYSGKYHTFENICDYSDIKLKYELFLPDLPIDINVNAKTGWVELKNISDDILRNFTLYCAHYRENRLIYLSSVFVDNLAPYNNDYESYKMEYPTEFYKADELRFFVWSNNLKPLCHLVAKIVNEPYYPEDMEFTDVELESKYYAAIKNMYLSGVTLAYEDGTFHPENYVMRNEASAMFCRLLGYWCNTYKFSCDDVPRENWESGYVGICVNEKIFELDENKFRPYENITVAETHEAIQNILEGQNSQIELTDLFTNIDLKNLERYITRAEFAQMLYNYQNCVNK